MTFKLISRPSSNVQTLLCGPKSFDRRNANELRKKPSASFLFLSFFSFSFLFFLFSFPFLSFPPFLFSFPLCCFSPLRTGCELPLFIAIPCSMHVDTWQAMCHTCICFCMPCVTHTFPYACFVTHGLLCVTHVACHVAGDTLCLETCVIMTVSEFNEIFLRN